MQADLICIDCIHIKDNLVCDAFPKGIPNIIISGENDHSEPLPKQDNDIVFEPKSSK